MLITGGTVFVSRYTAEYFSLRDWDVYVLNRNTRPQCEGVTLIECDRRVPGNCLRDKYFDAVLDITAYNAQDVSSLIDGLGNFGDYILLSSSAVYPESTPLPFSELSPIGENFIWGSYGLGKVEAEQELLLRTANSYIIRPPYLYGPMNNVYREAFVFDCALAGRDFYVPRDGSMPLQFFHVDDLCRFMEIILEQHPQQHIFNVGNPESITTSDWVQKCYSAVGKTAHIINVFKDIPPRQYFSFYDYHYYLDVSAQIKLMPDVKTLELGLQQSLEWYLNNREKMVKKPFIDFIDSNF